MAIFLLQSESLWMISLYIGEVGTCDPEGKARPTDPAATRKELLPEDITIILVSRGIPKQHVSPDVERRFPQIS